MMRTTTPLQLSQQSVFMSLSTFLLEGTDALAPESPTATMIARQSIVDPHGEVAGYEFFNRVRGHTTPSAADDASLIFAALSHAGCEELVQSKPIFVRCTHEGLASGQLELVSADNVVLQIESLGHAATSEVQARLPILQALRARGFKLSFRHTVLESAYAAWLPLADFIKFDLGVLRADQLAVLIGYAQRQTNAQVIAEKVENAQQYAQLKEMDVHWFQGAWFSRPALVQSRVLAPAHASIIQLINLLRQQAHPEAIEAVLKKDAALAFNLMRLMNSAGVGTLREITSFRQALLILGMKKMFRWAALLLTASKFGNLPSSVGQTAVVRGRLMELLALDLLSEDDADQAFVVGVFSLLDVMLQTPMDATLKLVSVPQAVSTALLERQGVLGELLTLAEACDSSIGELDDRLTSLSRLNPLQINAAHLQALSWADNLSA